MSSSVALRLNAKDGEAPISEWGGLVRSWQVYLRAEDRSPNTIETYEHAVIGRFLPWLVDIGWKGDLGGLTPEHFREWLNAMKAGGLSGATRLLYRSGVRSFFKFLKAEGEISVDPFLSGKVPNPKPENHVVDVLTGEEVAKMLRASSKDKQLGIRDAAIISILFDAGLRASELCGLTLEDVDLDGALLVRKGKGGRPRIVSLGKQSLRAVDRYLRWRREYVKRLPWVDEEDTEGALFLGRTGKPLSTASLAAVVHKLGKAAGIARRIHPHMFRHSAATSLADDGMGEGDMRELFGWSRGSPMVFRYTQTTAAERARRAHKRWSPLDKAARK